MPWRKRWRMLSTIKLNVAFLVESLADGSRAVLKTGEGKGRLRMAAEIVALERLHAAGASVPKPLEHNLAAFDSTNEPLYVVMEFIDGSNLTTRFRETRERLTREQYESTAACITTAHSLGILHGDLTTNNLMIRPDGSIVVIDWECGQHLQTEGTPIPPADASVWYERTQIALQHIWGHFAMGIIEMERKANIRPAIVGPGVAP